MPSTLPLLDGHSLPALGFGLYKVPAAETPQAGPSDAAPGADLEPVARIVAVRSGNLLATSFHPEVTGEKRVHELFIRMIRGEA